MIISGGVQNTHYNLVDTLRQFMGDEWHRCYIIITDYLRENCNPKTFLGYNDKSVYPFIEMRFIMHLSNLDYFIKKIDYTSPIRYTIIEAIVWQYINFELKEF